MGIQGLLPTLRSITRDVDLASYSGKKVAIDAYCWLHRGAYGCGTELCENVETNKYIQFCMGRIRMLQHFGVIPLVVFDGGQLPAKAATESQRRGAREENKAKAMALLKAGNRAAADDFFSRAVEVTTKMAYKFILALRQENIEYIVAPYEADAQMAFLCRENHVAAVITEDSDLLLYGCKQVLYKLDKDGNGKEIQLKNLGANEELNFLRWNMDMFLYMCILSGCDFLPSLPGMGLKTAHRFVKDAKNIDMIFRRMKASGQFTVPPNYEMSFLRALYTFQHHRVYDPQQKKLVCLNPLPPELEEDCHEYLGPDLSPDIAQKIAEGVLDPVSKQPYEPQEVPSDAPTVVATSTLPRRRFDAKNLPVQKNTIANYFTPVSTAVNKPFCPPRPTSKTQQEPSVGQSRRASASPGADVSSNPDSGPDPTRQASPLLSPSPSPPPSSAPSLPSTKNPFFLHSIQKRQQAVLATPGPISSAQSRPDTPPEAAESEWRPRQRLSAESDAGDFEGTTSKYFGLAPATRASPIAVDSFTDEALRADDAPCSRPHLVDLSEDSDTAPRPAPVYDSPLIAPRNGARLSLPISSARHLGAAPSRTSATSSSTRSPGLDRYRFRRGQKQHERPPSSSSLRQLPITTEPLLTQRNSAPPSSLASQRSTSPASSDSGSSNLRRKRPFPLSAYEHPHRATPTAAPPSNQNASVFASVSPSASPNAASADYTCRPIQTAEETNPIPQSESSQWHSPRHLQSSHPGTPLTHSLQPFSLIQGAAVPIIDVDTDEDPAANPLPQTEHPQVIFQSRQYGEGSDASSSTDADIEDRTGSSVLGRTVVPTLKDVLRGTNHTKGRTERDQQDRGFSCLSSPPSTTMTSMLYDDSDETPSPSPPPDRIFQQFVLPKSLTRSRIAPQDLTGAWSNSNTARF